MPRFSCNGLPKSEVTRTNTVSDRSQQFFSEPNRYNYFTIANNTKRKLNTINLNDTKIFNRYQNKNNETNAKSHMIQLENNNHPILCSLTENSMIAIQNQMSERLGEGGNCPKIIPIHKHMQQNFPAKWLYGGDGSAKQVYSTFTHRL